MAEMFSNYLGGSMIQNQYFYVSAISNYKSLKKTVFAVNHFHFQLHKLCSSSLCLLFLS